MTSLLQTEGRLARIWMRCMHIYISIDVATKLNFCSHIWRGQGQANNKPSCRQVLDSESGKSLTYYLKKARYSSWAVGYVEVASIVSPQKSRLTSKYRQRSASAHVWTESEPLPSFLLATPSPHKKKQKKTPSISSLVDFSLAAGRLINRFAQSDWFRRQ